MVFFPSQGTSQLQVLRHRLRPNYWPPQGLGVGITPITGKQLLALFPPIADDTYQFYKFYQIRRGQVPSTSQNVDWFNLLWQKRVQLTINVGKVPSTQNDFPTKINRTIPSLIGFTEEELRFTKLDNIQLKYEIEEFDTLTGKIIATVKMPTISDADDIFIYYDNPLAVDEQDKNAVWSNNFVVNQHMNQQSGNIIDSTSNGNDGIVGGGPENTAGKIGAAKFFGLTDVYFTPANPSLDTTNIAVYCWINIQTSNAFHLIASKWFNPGGAGNEDWHFSVLDGELDLFFPDDPNIASGMTLSINEDHLVGFVVRDITTLEMYMDGELSFTTTINPKPTSAGSRLQIGDDRNAPIQLDGSLDEFNMINGAVSPDWMKTVYNNQNDDDAFFSIGLEEQVPIQTNIPLVITDTLGIGILQQASGFDIRVFDFAGNPLPYESVDVTINLDTSADIILVFKMGVVKDGQIVQLTFGKSTDTDGQNPPAVYDVNYKSVYNLQNNADDSTGNAQNMTNFGSALIPVPGVIGNAQQYDGTVDDYSIRNPYTGFPTTELTCEFWFKTSKGASGLISYGVPGMGGAGFNHFLVIQPSSLLVYITGVSVDTGLALDDNILHHLVITWRSSDGKLIVYLDGVNVFETIHQQGVSFTDGGALVYAQDQDSLAGGFQSIMSLDGILDEVKFSNKFRSADYVATTFNNQNDNDAYWFKTPLLENGEKNFLVDNLGNRLVAVGN
jgi:hypothetical protein